MDFKRAQEIFNSQDTIEVFYNNNSVWIEGIHPENETVDVSINSTNGNVVTVNPTQLKEGNVIN